MSCETSASPHPADGLHRDDCTDHSCAEQGCREERSDCPTPMSWRDVLDEFREAGRAWEIDRGSWRVQGRTLGTGRPLYFLNGMGGTHEQFALLAWLLREEFRCVLFDYPERRANGRGCCRPTLDQLADDVLAIADLHGDERIDLFASSFGSLVALTTMLRAPQRIGGAILQGGFAHRVLSVFERSLIRLCSHLPGRVGQLPLRALVQQHNHRRWFPPFDLTRWQFFLDDTGTRRAAAQAWRAGLIAQTDLRERLADIQCPVLLLHAEGDGLVVESCQRTLEQGLPRSRTEWLSNAGHLPQLTHPHRTARVVREFFSDGEAPCSEFRRAVPEQVGDRERGATPPAPPSEGGESEKSESLSSVEVCR